MQGGGEAVGRVDAVVTCIQILAEQLLIAEAVFRGIEIGQIVLRFGGDVVVKQARFQRLYEIITEQFGRALKRHAGINIENRQSAANRAAGVVLKII